MNGSKDDKEIIVLLKENQLYLYVTSFKAGFVTKKKKSSSKCYLHSNHLENSHLEHPSLSLSLFSLKKNLSNKCIYLI